MSKIDVVTIVVAVVVVTATSITYGGMVCCDKEDAKIVARAAALVKAVCLLIVRNSTFPLFYFFSHPSHVSCQ